MKYKNVYGDIPEQIAAERGKKAIARARYRVQDDFNRELIDKIAKKTGHPNLATTCFVDVDLNSKDELDVRVYNDWTVIEGMYKSNSSFHQGGGKWKSIKKHYHMTQEEFYESKYSGDDDEDYGTLDPEWLADNFWDGIYYATNGWPCTNKSLYLQVYKYRDTSALSVIESYYEEYVNTNRFGYYIQEELNSM